MWCGWRCWDKAVTRALHTRGMCLYACMHVDTCLCTDKSPRVVCLRLWCRSSPDPPPLLTLTLLHMYLHLQRERRAAPAVGLSRPHGHHRECVHAAAGKVSSRAPQQRLVRPRPRPE